MNIYLDIDGVLLINENNAAPYADEFIQAILKYYPETTYWLTTHCWQGENRTHGVLSPHLKPDTVKLLEQIKPTEWGDFKTDPIDFSKPFLWFDDDLYPEEKTVLEENDALERWIGIDLQKNPNQLKELVDSVNDHHKNTKRENLSDEDLKQATKFFELLLEIDNDQKNKQANKTSSDTIDERPMKNSSRQQIAKKIKQVRTEKSLTQLDVAEKSGVSVNYYARIERADVKPSVETLEKIVKALGVKSSDILPF